MNKQHPFDDGALLTQAYDWVVKLQKAQCHEQEQEQDAFLQWIDNPKHAKAFADAQEQHNHLNLIKNDTDIISLRQEVLSQPIVCGVHVDDAKEHPTSPAISFITIHKKRIATTISIGLCVAASLLIVTLLPYFSGIHHTGVGEVRTLTLEDGTKIMLDTQSSIRVAYSDHKRMVYLRSGRAHFAVAKNAKRPFTVKSANNAVTAVGTEFSVNNIDDRFIVRLNEGVVDVQSPSVSNPKTNNTIRLQEGEQWLALNKTSGKKETLNINQLNWMKGSLVFEDATLDKVIAEINRYSDIKIQLANQELTKNKIDAVFYMGKTTHFAEALQSLLNVELSYDHRGNIILSQ